jgi:geranylgeranyl diphosphate synthase type I
MLPNNSNTDSFDPHHLMDTLRMELAYLLDHSGIPAGRAAILADLCQRAFAHATGKMLRGQLGFLACRQGGLDETTAYRWAAYCEILHHGTLIHDDIQDGDRIRRDRPTLWMEVGVAQAINLGNFLLQVPAYALDRLTVCRYTQRALRVLLGEKLTQVISGQCMDCAEPLVGIGNFAAYEACVWQKTGSFFALPVEGGAVLAASLGNGMPREVLRDAAYEWGILFQIYDDLLDLYGNKHRGRVGEDLREGKISALVVRHLEAKPGDRERVLAVLTAPKLETAESEVTWALLAFQESGATQALWREVCLRREALWQRLDEMGQVIFARLYQHLCRENLVSLST